MTDSEFLNAIKQFAQQHSDGLLTDRETANAIILLTTEFLDTCEGDYG